MGPGSVLWESPRLIFLPVVIISTAKKNGYPFRIWPKQLKRLFISARFGQRRVDDLDARLSALGTRYSVLDSSVGKKIQKNLTLAMRKPHIF